VADDVVKAFVEMLYFLPRLTMYPPVLNSGADIVLPVPLSRTAVFVVRSSRVRYSPPQENDEYDCTV